MLYAQKSQQNEESDDVALSAVSVPGDLEELKADASDALRELEAKQDRSPFEKEALEAGKMPGL